MESQHAFTKGRSCLTNLFEFLENATSDLDKGNPVDIIYLDLQKLLIRFLIRLFKKMFAHGVGGKILGWIQNWLLDRKQKVSINGTYS